jgi:hypothetical protein
VAALSVLIAEKGWDSGLSGNLLAYVSAPLLPAGQIRPKRYISATERLSAALMYLLPLSWLDPYNTNNDYYNDND